MLSPLTSKTAATVLSALDNQSSLWPLLVKDGGDNIGRSISEFKRGGKGAHHAGRERLIEEFSTTAVWLGGRKFFEAMIFNPLMRYKGLDPAVDLQLLLNKTGQKLPGWIIGNRQAYIWANLAKFAMGTVLPAVIIACAIPKVNQAITRLKYAQEKTGQTMVKTNTPLESMIAALSAPTKPARQLHRTLPGTLDSRHDASCRMGYQNAPAPFISASSPWTGPYYAGMPYRSNGIQGPRFGGNGRLMEGAARLINNDFWGNVAIDAGISSGRLYNARNWVDFMEIGVREASIVGFLYFLGDWLKGNMNRLFDRKLGTLTDLTFESLHWLKSQSVGAKVWQADLERLKGLNKNNALTVISGLLNPKTGQFDKNPVFELARLQGKIATVSQADAMPVESLKQLFSKQIGNPHAQFRVDPRKFLDLEDIQLGRKTLWERLARTLGFSAKAHGRAASIQAGMVPRLIKILEKNANPKAFTQWLTRNTRFKLFALATSYAVSWACLGWLSPLFQHWLTKTLTGKVDFPGTREDVRQFQKMQ